MRLFLGFIIGLAIAVAIAATAFKVAWGGIADIEPRDRGSDVTHTVEASDFDRIEVGGVFELEVTVGGDYSVILSGRQSDLDRTTVAVENGVLVLDSKERDRSGKRKLIKHGVTATITMPALNGVSIAGVVEGDIKGVSAETFEAELSGVGELDISGTCGFLDADLSGVGELDAEELLCRSVDVKLLGVGEASVYASESVAAEIAGIGHIEISGSPKEISKSQSSPFGRISVN